MSQEGSILPSQWLSFVHKCEVVYREVGKESNDDGVDCFVVSIGFQSIDVFIGATRHEV